MPMATAAMMARGRFPLRVLDLARELVSLLEAEVREDDAGADDRPTARP